MARALAGTSTVLGVELTPATASGYVRLAFDQMLAVAERVGNGHELAADALLL